MGAEDIRDSQRFDPLLAGGDDFDERELALDVGAFATQVGDLVDRHQAIELRLDLLDDHGRAQGHQIDAGESLAALDLGDGQALDIVAAPGEEADDPRQNPRLVLDQHGKRAALGGVVHGRSSRPPTGGRPAAAGAPARRANWRLVSWFGAAGS